MFITPNVMNRSVDNVCFKYSHKSFIVGPNNTSFLEQNNLNCRSLLFDFQIVLLMNKQGISIFSYIRIPRTKVSWRNLL